MDIDNVDKKIGRNTSGRCFKIWKSGHAYVYRIFCYQTWIL